jgi:hypothetical protein
MGLAFLTKGAAKTVRALEADISKLKATKDQRTTELAKTLAALATAQERVQALLLDDKLDESKIKAVEADQLSHERRISALRLALETIDRQIADKRAEMDATITRELGEKLAATHEADLSAYKNDMDDLVAALRKVSVSASKVGEITFAAREMAELTGSMASQFPISFEVAAAEAQRHINGLRNGSVKPKQPTVAPVVEPKPQKPEIARRTVLALAQIEWTEDDGQHTCGKHGQAKLPVELAAKAISLRYAIDFSDDRVRQLACGHVTAPRPGTNGNIDLNTVTEAAQPVFGPRDTAAQASGMTVVHGGV